jgi:cell division protease FtsH
VSFAYQLEHLVNLDLLEPSSNFKSAQNESHLVSFSGKFREQLSEDSKKRYEYLELLSQNKQLASQKNALETELSLLKNTVLESATSFLTLTGEPLNSSGYTVISKHFDQGQISHAITIASLQDQAINLQQTKSLFEQIKNSPSQDNVITLKGNLEFIVQNLRSPKIGISDNDMKLQLKNMQDALSSKNVSFATIEHILNDLSTMATNLTQEKNYATLTQLRPVRNYLEFVEQYNSISQQLEANSIELDKARLQVLDKGWFFNNQELTTKALEKQDNEAFANWFISAKQEWNNFNYNHASSFKVPSQPMNVVMEKKFQSEEPTPGYMSYLPIVLMGLLATFAIYFMFTRQMKGMGSSAMNFGKSPARLLTKEQNNITFKDVAGAEEAKEELQEIVEFLKDPHKYTSLGARIPKGVLLVGSPGTGKTLIAKAVAGEADRPFFSISGSDFVEMFVGVGASRIRDLFSQAKKQAPCIIFMDEIDAVGRQRGAGIGGGHDEREQTLNQLLVEMDGFDTKEGVILMAATNRPDILDRALLRPGRFDRRVVLELPDVKGRYEILKVHARRIKIDPTVNLMDIAKNTPGGSGADLENILNEAALLAARHGRSAVTQPEVTEACDKVRFGKERRSLERDNQERKTTAYHESGHAIVGLKVENADPVDKVTIMPRGFSLGATHFMPKKNRLNYWRKEIIDELAICMGGRAAEEIFLSDMSSGAQQDIQQATKLARAMVCQWGMTDNLGQITYDERKEGGEYLGLTSFYEKNYSEETAKKIDDEVFKLIDEAHKRAQKIVQDNRATVELMTEMLMEFETLDKEDIQEMMNNTWDVEKKRSRLKIASELQRKKAPPPPPNLDIIKDNPMPDQA